MLLVSEKRCWQVFRRLQWILQNTCWTAESLQLSSAALADLARTKRGWAVCVRSMCQGRQLWAMGCCQNKALLLDRTVLYQALSLRHDITCTTGTLSIAMAWNVRIRYPCDISFSSIYDSQQLKALSIGVRISPWRPEVSNLVHVIVVHVVTSGEATTNSISLLVLLLFFAGLNSVLSIKKVFHK